MKTLEQLIDECGLGLRSLSKHSDGRWIAKGGKSVFPTGKLFTGKTHKEVITKLLKAINNMEHKQIALDCPEWLQFSRNSKTIGIDEGIVDTIKHLWKHKIITLGTCQEDNINPTVGVSENYREKDIKKILKLIKEVDDREWIILQWKLSKVNNETVWI